ncbi:MAG: AAA family ATPase [Myxococcota bacterium]|nr:AAA family ATPase [Myxococcota bacterium]
MRFDDYTDVARRVVEEANATARQERHTQLSAAQVLLTLLDANDSQASNIFGLIGTDRKALRAAVSMEVKEVPRVTGQDRLVIEGPLVRVFDLARTTARSRGEAATSTGHLLGALTDIEGTPARKLLADAQVTTDKVLDALTQVDNPEGRRGDEGDETSWLERLSLDLTARAAAGRLDPVIGRDDEIRRVMEVLCRRRKNNPLLIGEPGVGKTAIVEGLAHRLAEGDVPDALRGRRLLALDMAGIVAGTSLRGEFEERLRGVLAEVTAADGHVLLFIDEIHHIVGAGGSSGGGMDASALLKPALARGELHCLGATTIREYRQSLERDPALARRFQTITVEEPDPGEALSILRGAKAQYEVHHGVQIRDAALAASVELSSRYVSDRRLPDKALDLVDEAASRLRLEVDAVPAEIDEVRRRIKRLEIERTALTTEASTDAMKQRALVDKELTGLQTIRDGQLIRWKRERDIFTRIRQVREQLGRLSQEEEEAGRAGDLDRAAEIRFGRLPELNRSLAALEGDLAVAQKDGGWLSEAVEADDIAEVVATWTGIPLTRLTEGETTKLLELERRLGTRVLGQSHAVEAVSRVIRRSRAGIQDPNRPLGSFLFLGPTGVGKTHLVKTVAELLFDDDHAMVRLDMSEYMEKHSVSRLVGAPPGYVGHEEGGQLTEAVRRRPYTVVLLDEVEKAHAEVFDLLLQVLDEGRLTDSMGRTVSFRNTLIVMTSNLGSEAIVDAEEGDDEGVEEAVQAAVRSFFRPEMLNRIDELVIFRRLEREAIQAIVRLQLNELSDRLSQRELLLEVTEEAIAHLAEEGYEPSFGARPVKRVIRSLVEDPLAYKLIAGELEDCVAVRVELIGDDETPGLGLTGVPRAHAEAS